MAFKWYANKFFYKWLARNFIKTYVGQAHEQFDETNYNDEFVFHNKQSLLSC